MKDDVQRQSILANLSRIEGQVRGIRKMVEEPRLCTDILQQLAAAQASLSRVSSNVLKFHVEVCVPAAVTAGGDEQARRLAELVEYHGSLRALAVDATIQPAFE